MGPGPYHRGPDDAAAAPRGRTGGWHAGTADALWRAAPLIRQYGPDALLVLSADAVYPLDYRQVVDEDLDAGGEVTMVTTDVDPDEAARYGMVRLDLGRVRRYDYKPDQPQGGTVSSEVFVFCPDPSRTAEQTLTTPATMADGREMPSLHGTAAHSRGLCCRAGPGHHSRHRRAPRPAAFPDAPARRRSGN